MVAGFVVVVGSRAEQAAVKQRRGSEGQGGESHERLSGRSHRHVALPPASRGLYQRQARQW